MPWALRRARGFTWAGQRAVPAAAAAVGVGGTNAAHSSSCPAFTNYDERRGAGGLGGLGVEWTCVNTISLHANAVRHETGCLQFRAIGQKTGRRYQSIRAFASRHGTLR